MKFFGKNFQKGYVFVLIACMVPFFIMLSSLVIDLGRGYVYKSRLQNIADAAALAGAMQMEHYWEKKTFFKLHSHKRTTNCRLQ